MSYGNSPGGPGEQADGPGAHADGSGVQAYGSGAQAGGPGEQGGAGQDSQGEHGGRLHWGPADQAALAGPARGHGYGVAPHCRPGQPAGYGAPLGSYGSPPPTYLPWGIAAIVGGVLFCLIGGVPTGLASTHFARQVIPRWQAGDQQGALDASRKARIWAIVSTVLDVLGLIFAIYLLSSSAAGTVG